MDQIVDEQIGMKGIKFSTFKNATVVAILFFALGALISGSLVFWLQEKNLKSLTDEVKQNSQLNIDYDQIYHDIETAKSTYKIIDSCSGEKCLFQGSEAVEGFGYLEGYYSTREEVYHDSEPHQCDVLVTSGGSQELINDFFTTIERGNAINALDENGLLMITISLDGLSDQDKNSIKNSTLSNKVKVDVVRTTPKGMGAPPCGSYIDIVKVE